MKCEHHRRFHLMGAENGCCACELEAKTAALAAAEVKAKAAFQRGLTEGHAAQAIIRLFAEEGPREVHEASGLCCSLRLDERRRAEQAEAKVREQQVIVACRDSWLADLQKRIYQLEITRLEDGNTIRKQAAEVVRLKGIIVRNCNPARAAVGDGRAIEDLLFEVEGANK